MRPLRRRLAYVSVMLLIGTALAGCLGTGGESLPEDVDDTDTNTSKDDLPATGAVVHGPNASVDGVAIDPDAATPVGVSQLTGFPAFEPTIGVTDNGTLFMSNYGGTPGTNWTSVVRSTDQGQTWTDVTPAIGPAASPPQSNDPYVYVDEATNRVYNLDMQGLSCNYIQWSDDEGQSWTQNPVGCGATPLLDHPTIFAGSPRTEAGQAATDAAGYENVVYLCVNRVFDSACSRSFNGGMTWDPFTTVYPGADPNHAEPDPADPFGTVTSGFCGGLHAHGTTGPNGTVYLPKGQCGTPSVAVSQDDGLTWDVVAISEDVETRGHEVAFAVDDAGNAYASWINPDRKPYLAVSTDGGMSWNDPMMVAPPDVGTTAFPTVAAGADGQVAVAYIGTEADVPYDAMGHSDTWNAYITMTTDATAGNATFATVPVNHPDDPIARGECGGSRCYPPSGGALGDFIDVVVGPDGRPWAAFVDACTEECVSGEQATNDHGVGLVGTVSQGPSLIEDGAELPELAWADV